MSDNMSTYVGEMLWIQLNMFVLAFFSAAKPKRF